MVEVILSNTSCFGFLLHSVPSLVTGLQSILIKALFLAGPETLLKQPSNWNDGQEGYFGGDSGDAIECHDWRCIRTINGTLLSFQ